MRVRVRKEMQITVAGNVVVATTLTVAGVGWLWLMRDAVGLVHHSAILFDYCVLTCRDGVGN